jgi:hypothetical protein
MTKQLLAGVAAVVFMSGVAFAQSVPGSSTSTTTVTPTPEGSQSSTTKQGVEPNGNDVTKKDIYKQGAAGSSETHKKTETDPSGGGTTTNSTTITKPQ